MGTSRPASPPPVPGVGWLLLAVGVACLLLLNLAFAPDWLAEGAEAGAEPAPVVTAEPTPTTTESAPRVPAAARVPTIVARFTTESREPVDESGIKALAMAMIEDHDALVVLEGHSDTIGADDFNHDLSLERANLVKGRLVQLGVSEERIETVGLGATRPLRSDVPDAASVNRRVEIRWVGKGDPSWRANARDAGRPATTASVPVVPAPGTAEPPRAPETRPDAAATPATAPSGGGSNLMDSGSGDKPPPTALVADAGPAAVPSTPVAPGGDAGE